ncbi:unnamed protein product [Ilex paraguariensis]|uniref:Rho GTPase-activating protein REN1-like n=1 Tax=Ilex paraguariensis TaxID=185542 RepID=A0ABC8T6F2_9AQUA
MTNKNTGSSQGDFCNPQPPPGPPSGPPSGAADHLHSRGNNKVYKSGPLFLSSRGIGWTSWKKRWFILTRTSLVFFRSDPNGIPQKGSEVNLTLGGIDLNSSGSVVVKADKKLLTVLFPDGRDGRAFTLKSETLEDLNEWKAALEEALANAPSAALVMGQNGIFKNDQGEEVDGLLEQSKDRLPVKSLVIGRPILLALEDIDGTPSFLEKALRFLEQHGIQVEGILRQAADVDDVERRIREYEQGKSEFSSEEDPHIIADCVKYVLRELPSSPVPASCCKALLEAFRTDRGMRLTAMRTAICETFPEPNRRLLQRILMMMQTVASHKAENRMSTAAVAACMAPLLLRPLLAGDCELENDFDVGGDGSVQLLQAAAAANHAQAIIITLLEEYGNLFGEGSVSPELYSDSEESGSDSEELTDDGETLEDDGDDDATEGSDADVVEDFECASSGTSIETSDAKHKDLYDNKGSEACNSCSKSNEVDDDLKVNQKVSSSAPQTSLPQHDNEEESMNRINANNNSSVVEADEPGEVLEDDPAETSSINILIEKSPSSCVRKSTTVSNGPVRSVRRPTVWGRTPAKRNLSMESIDVSPEDEDEIQRLEVTKTDLQNKIAEEAKGNAILQESLEKRRNALHERRLALEKDVARLQEQLQKETELRMVLEAGLKKGTFPVSAAIDEKMKADLDEISRAEADVTNLKQKAFDLGVQLSLQREQNYEISQYSNSRPQQSSNQVQKYKQKDFEATAISHTFEKVGRNKNSHSDKAASDRNLKHEPPPLLNRHPSENELSDSLFNSKTYGVLATPSYGELGVGRTSSTASKKLGTRGEGSNSTTSALSKLTTRLNFLKERRTQIANELQNMDKGRNSGQSVQNLARGKGSEVQSLEKGSGLDSCLLPQNPGKGMAEGQSIQNLDKGGRSEGIQVSNLDRGKSEFSQCGQK